MLERLKLKVTEYETLITNTEKWLRNPKRNLSQEAASKAVLEAYKSVVKDLNIILDSTT